MSVPSSMRCSSHCHVSRGRVLQEPEAGYVRHLCGGRGPRIAHCWWRNFPGIPTRIQTMDLEILMSLILFFPLQIEFYLGDWKFLTMATGVDSASSTHACIWCKYSAGEQWDTSKQWSLDNPAEDGSQTIEENLAASDKEEVQRIEPPTISHYYA